MCPRRRGAEGMGAPGCTQTPARGAERVPVVAGSAHPAQASPHRLCLPLLLQPPPPFGDSPATPYLFQPCDPVFPQAESFLHFPLHGVSRTFLIFIPVSTTASSKTSLHFHSETFPSSELILSISLTHKNLIALSPFPSSS